MGKHSEDPETIIHEVIPVIAIKLNSVKLCMEYKKPCSMRSWCVLVQFITIDCSGIHSGEEDKILVLHDGSFASLW